MGMPKIIWSCSHCGTILPLWQVKCSNCQRLALSWLHLIVGLAVALVVVFGALKLI
jgi:translation initiation factor IF-1